MHINAVYLFALNCRPFCCVTHAAAGFILCGGIRGALMSSGCSVLPLVRSKKLGKLVSFDFGKHIKISKA